MSTVRAFIVEDSPVILENLVATLEELTPVKVVGSAIDESAAVDWLRHSRGDCQLVIVDIFLKTGSGLGVLRRMADMGFEGQRVVLTNYATPDVRERCASLGAHRVFDKSQELDELISYCADLGAASPARN